MKQPPLAGNGGSCSKEAAGGQIPCYTSMRQRKRQRFDLAIADPSSCSSKDGDPVVLRVLIQDVPAILTLRFSNPASPDSRL